MPPLVSIIMPTFNRPEFLPPAVASVFAQSLPDWELIIADDGSDADTRAYLQTLHGPPRVRVLWLPHSGKPSVARNAALRAARGEYVAFLDSDDLWLPQKLEIQIASLRAHPGRSWSYTGFAVINAAGASDCAAIDRGSSAPSGWIAERMLDDEVIVALPTVIVLRALLEQLGAFDEELVSSEDDELWLRLALHGQIDGLAQPLTLIRRHTQHSADDATAWRERRRVFEKALRGSADPHLNSILRGLRAQMSAGLANSQACGGLRVGVLCTLAASAHYSWRYLRWWSGAARALARAFTPAPLRSVIRRYRSL